MPLTFARDVRTRRSSHSSGMYANVLIVTSMRPRIRSCVRLEKSDSWESWERWCVLRLLLSRFTSGLISRRLFPDKFRYRKLVLKFLQRTS